MARDDPPVGSFLALLPLDDRDALARAGTARHFAKGSPLFLEGDLSDHAVLITKGQVKVFTTGPSGRELVLSTRGRGDLLGEMAAIDRRRDARRAATVLALEPVDVRVLSADTLEDLIRSRPAIGLELLRILTNRLRHSDRRRAEFGSYDTTQRVATVLAEMAEMVEGERQGGDASDIRLSLSQEELAGIVGTSRESVVRALTSLRTQRLIATGRRSIIVASPRALRSFVG